MTTPSSSVISMNDVLAELRVANPGRSVTISLGDADVRNLAGAPSGQIGLSNLYGKSSFTVKGNSDSGSFSSISSAGTARCYPSVTVIGGAAPVGYSWSFTSNPNTCTLSGANTATCTVSKSYFKNAEGFASATLQCVVSDSAGNSRTVTASASLEWYGNM